MRQAKYNETARLAKEGKLPPKPKPKKLTQVEFYEKLMGSDVPVSTGHFSQLGRNY